MNKAELKKKLFRYIDNLDENHLYYFYNLFVKDSEKGDFWELLTEEQKDDIQKGLDDLNSGRKKDIDDVLNKYI